jgi:dihydroxy-acid dehydratase
MASVAEAMGMTLPGCAAIPAPDSRRLTIAELSGQRMVQMVWDDVRPSKIMTREALENAITVNMAIGGSTNAVVHLLAIAGRLGIDLKLDEFDRISRRTPCIANIKPSGQYLMEDLFEAGGVPVVMNGILPLLHGEALTVNGKTVRENVEGAQCWNRDVIRESANPLSVEGGTVILGGNLAPRGAVIKHTAASPHLLQHRGPAFVFETYKEMHELIDSPDLAVTRDSVLVMKSCGPKGAPGFPEWGQIPMPRVLLDQGVDDVVRISDARMSGTSFGTVVLHVAPESAVGGPLAAVETGDEVELDTAGRKLTLHVAAEEIERRLAARPPAPPHYERGYGWMFLQHVNQADEGCDFDFLRKRGL